MQGRGAGEDPRIEQRLEKYGKMWLKVHLDWSGHFSSLSLKKAGKQLEGNIPPYSPRVCVCQFWRTEWGVRDVDLSQSYSSV